MATTTYAIMANDEQVGTKSKKSTACDAARAFRDEHRVAVQVVTGAGTVVLDLQAPKKIKMSKPYTRVVALPEGVEVPEGLRVAYFRPRVGLALLHDANAERDEQYRFLDTKSGTLSAEAFRTTREAGAAFVAARKAKAEQATA